MHPHHRRLNGMVGGRVRGGTNHGNGKKYVSSWSASDDPPTVDTRAGGENTLTAQNKVLFFQTWNLLM